MAQTDLLCVSFTIRVSSMLHEVYSAPFALAGSSSEREELAPITLLTSIDDYLRRTELGHFQVTLKGGC